MLHRPLGAIFMGATTATDSELDQEILDSDLSSSIRATVRAVGEPDPAQLDMIGPHYLDPAAMNDHPPYVVHAEVSNNQIDAYFTRMHMSSLKNYAEDAKAGVAFMNSHRTGGFASAAEQPYGQSFDSKLTGASGNGIARVDEWFYLPMGTSPNGPAMMSTDDMVRAIRTGSGRDISIGFYGARFLCSICGLDMARDWNCRHFPGTSYPVLDAKGNETTDVQTAFAWIHDAHQAEASLVYDGATPGCMTKKAKRMAAAGELPEKAIDLLEARYRIALPHPARRFPGAPTPETEGTDMPDADEKKDEQRGAPPVVPPIDQLAGIRKAMETRGIKPDASPAEVELGIRQLLQDADTAIAFATPENRALVEEGKTYRNDLVTDAMTQGARAIGKGFAEATYRGLLETAPLETVKRMRDDWKAQADAEIPTGRTTESEEDAATVKAETAERGNGTSRRPDAAYRA